MTLYLLNHFSNVALVLLIVGGTTALAVVVTIVVHKLFPNLADSGFEEQTGILRADVFALLYTVVLALVISDLSGNLEKASSKVSSEASALSVLTRCRDVSFRDNEVDKRRRRRIRPRGGRGRVARAALGRAEPSCVCGARGSLRHGAGLRAPYSGRTSLRCPV
jgi:hypothetical protein